MVKNQGVKLKLNKVLEYITDVNEKRRSKIKSSAKDVLLAAHIISKNANVLQATVVAKIAKTLKNERLENFNLHNEQLKALGKEQKEIDFKLKTLSKVKKVKKQKAGLVINNSKNIVIDSVEVDKYNSNLECVNYHYIVELEGDIQEALFIFNAFKQSGQIELDNFGKLKKVIMHNENKDQSIVHVKNTEQTELEIRRGIENQGLPNSVKKLSQVKYSIDTAIRDTAETFDFDDYANINALANTYGRENEEFNINYFADSRIRIYPENTSGYSPQGSDLGKALIKNKLLKADRDLTPLFIKQAEEFMDGKCPFIITKDNLLLIDYKTAPKYKFRMLQLQNDYKEYLWTGCTSANVDLDARCSGSQILSGLMFCRDVTANIGMEKEEAVLDLYEKNAEVFTQIVKEDFIDIYNNNTHLIENGVFIRKVSKRPTMTFVYNATLTSIMKEFRNLGFTDGDVILAAKIMKLALEKSAGGTYDIMEWFKDSARKISKKGNKTIQWTRPDGLLASQTYIKKCSIRVDKTINYTNAEIKHALMSGRKKPKSGWKHCIKSQFNVPHLGLDGQEITDVNKHVNGIAADITHSLDSCVAMKVIDILTDKGIEVTRFVHDSISVHMNYRDDLYNAVIEAHIWLFNSNFLENLKEEWEIMYGVSLNSLPEKGDWKPETLRECKSFWE